MPERIPRNRFLVPIKHAFCLSSPFCRLAGLLIFYFLSPFLGHCTAQMSRSSSARLNLLGLPYRQEFPRGSQEKREHTTSPYPIAPSVAGGPLPVSDVSQTHFAPTRVESSNPGNNPLHIEVPGAEGKRIQAGYP